MKVNKELVDKVAKAMNELSRDDSFTFSYDNLLDTYKLRSDSDKRVSGSYMICCPFHSDEDPSLAIYDSDNCWYCYGCQRSGDLLQFIVELKKLQGNCSRASVANDILRKESIIQEMTGIDTVYVRDSLFTSTESIPFSRFKIQSEPDLTYLTLADKVKKIGDKNKIEQAILLMQEGTKPRDIDEILFKQHTTKSYDVNSLWE